MTFKQAMWLAKEQGKSVRCEYMSPGWTIKWIEWGWFCVNPHNGSNYQFTPQKIDHESKWSVI